LDFEPHAAFDNAFAQPHERPARARAALLLGVCREEKTKDGEGIVRQIQGGKTFR
jgi:hypothetical protein